MALDLSVVFSQIMSFDDKFRGVVIGRIDQEIARKEKELEQIRATKASLTQGKIVAAEKPRQQTQGKTRGRPKGSKNKPQGQPQGQPQGGTHRQAILELVKSKPGMTSGELKEALDKSGHEIDTKVLHSTLHFSLNKYGEIRKEGTARNLKYYPV